MPFAASFAYIVTEMGEWRQDELAEERAAGEGMFERHIDLVGVHIPRMLSWAELRALRNDLHEARI